MSSPVEEFMIKIGVEVDKESFDKVEDYFAQLTTQIHNQLCAGNQDYVLYVEGYLLSSIFEAAKKRDFAVLEEFTKAYQRVKSVNN